MKHVKTALIAIVTVTILFALFRISFVRTVNYSIGGVKIPSEYNVLTGSVKPIPNYHGTSNLPVVESHQMGNAGLPEAETAGAQLRWSVFEQWIKTKPEYKGWESDPELFKKAQDDYKKNIEPHTRAIVIK